MFALSYLMLVLIGTRQAYGLAGPNVEKQEFAVSATPLGRDDLDKNAPTLRDARIWDWRALEPQLQQIQGLRPYYTFSGVDIDRYRVCCLPETGLFTTPSIPVTTKNVSRSDG
jgi:uncharacterized protein